MLHFQQLAFRCSTRVYSATGESSVHMYICMYTSTMYFISYMCDSIFPKRVNLVVNGWVSLCPSPQKEIFGQVVTFQIGTLLLICYLFSSFNSVPVGIWSTTMPPGQPAAIGGPAGGVAPGPTEASSTALADPSAALPEHGCDIDGQYYMDGMQVI